VPIHTQVPERFEAFFGRTHMLQDGQWWTVERGYYEEIDFSPEEEIRLKHAWAKLQKEFAKEDAAKRRLLP